MKKDYYQVITYYQKQDRVIGSRRLGAGNPTKNYTPTTLYTYNIALRLLKEWSQEKKVFKAVLTLNNLLLEYWDRDEFIIIKKWNGPSQLLLPGVNNEASDISIFFDSCVGGIVCKPEYHLAFLKRETGCTTSLDPVVDNYYQVYKGEEKIKMLHISQVFFWDIGEKVYTNLEETDE